MEQRCPQCLEIFRGAHLCGANLKQRFVKKTVMDALQGSVPFQEGFRDYGKCEACGETWGTGVDCSGCATAAEHPFGAFVKHDEGKIRPELLPPRALEEVSAVLAHGAAKYTRRWSSSLPDAVVFIRESCKCGNTTKVRSATRTDDMPDAGCVTPAMPDGIRRHVEPHVTPSDSSTPEGCAVFATTESSRREIPNTQNGSDSIASDGHSNTRNKCGASAVHGESETPPQRPQKNDVPRWPSSDSPGRTNSGYSTSREEGARSADLSEDVAVSTWTTVTRPGASAASSAVDATKDSDFWETLSRLSKGHSPTCEVSKIGVRPIRDGVEITVDGANNWHKCEDPSRYVGAALRHILAHMRGETNDPETGRLHLAHAICSLSFVSELELRKNQNQNKDTK